MFVVNCAEIFVFLSPRFYRLHKFTRFNIEYILTGKTNINSVTLLAGFGSLNKGCLKSVLLIKSRWKSLFLIHRTLENLSTFIIPHEMSSFRFLIILSNKTKQSMLFAYYMKKRQTKNSQQSIKIKANFVSHRLTRVSEFMLPLLWPRAKEV